MCGVTLAILAMAAPEASASYRRTISKHTERGRYYSFNSLDAELVWHATILTSEVVSAQKELLTKKGLTGNFDYFAKQKDDALSAGRPIFFVSMYTNKNLESFSLDKSSKWIVRLITSDGAEIEPLKIETVTISPTESIFYYYLNRWSRCYMVEFPAIEIGSDFSLELRSAVTSSQLTWKLKADDTIKAMDAAKSVF